jgi:lysophospholipase L1-like esterase
MWFKKILTILISIIVSLLLVEVVLNIYNPFQSRVRGNEIILKSNYKKNVVIDPPINGLDKQFTYTTNSIGFRGPEPPNENEWDATKTIITIGGSTTECSLLADDSTWSAHLYKNLKINHPDLWLNNAGLDGCSSYGHIILMRDYIVKLKPDYAVFLVGINDLVKSTFENEDGFLINRKESFMRKVMKKSEVFTLVANIMEASKSSKANVAHGTDPYGYKNNDINNPDSAYQSKLTAQLKVMVPAYVDRINQINDLCKSANIKPIFVTQPKFDDTSSISWKIMEMYNEALRKYCQEKNINCIDLANQMPKEVQYYYDQIHYTNLGARKIADILSPQINQIISKQ